MRVKDVRATAVNVPMVAPYRFSFGSLGSFTTTIVEVEDEDGVVGIGERPHGDLATRGRGAWAALAGVLIDDLNGCEARVLSSRGSRRGRRTRPPAGPSAASRSRSGTSRTA